MTQDGNLIGRRATAGGQAALALACLSAAISGPAMAQDALPSVNDYHLPSGTATPAAPRVRPQGPVDPENPIATPPRAVAPSAAEPAASASAAPGPAASRPAARASASPAASSAPARTAAPRPAPAATPAVPTATAPSPAASPVAAGAVAAEQPGPASSLPAIEWRVHSAADGAAGGSWWWQSLWMVALAFAAGIGLALLFQSRRRNRRNALAAADDWAVEVGAAEPELPVTPAAQKPALDLIAAMAEPLESAPPAPSAPAAPRPALNVHVNPLEVELAARRLSATLMNAVLNYELVVRNTGKTAIGPIVVGGDMIGAHASLPDRTQLELTGDQIAPLHRLASLAPGESATLAGEFKLALADITPIRSGNAALFIPLARFRVEAARRGAPPLVASSTYVIGENQDSPGAALRPFRLDLGPRLYSSISQRELALSA